MHTFLFLRANGPTELRKTLETTRRCLRKYFPSPYGSPCITETCLPSSGIGWLSITPGNLRVERLWHAVNPNYAALAFGTKDINQDQNPAATLLENWTKTGESGLRDGRGNFSAIIVDRLTDAIYLYSDPVGNTSLMYHYSASEFIASPHDLTLLATGTLQFELDYDAICGMIATGWAPGGTSLIKGVNRLEPYNLLKLRHSGPKKYCFDICTDQDRIDANDLAAIKRNREHMEATFSKNIVDCASNTTQCHVTLSAGIDSRAIFSVLASRPHRTHLEIISSGPPSSQDVKTAKRLADLYGIQFRNPPTDVITEDDIRQNLEIFAFAMNGDLCEGGHLFQLLPKDYYLNNQPTVFFGGGGELYTGNDRLAGRYSLLRDFTRGNISVEEGLRGTVDDNNRKVDSLPWRTDDLATLAKRAFEHSVAPLASFASNAFDFLDLFYLYEKMGVWGNTKARMTWFSRYKTPYHDWRLCTLAFRMPYPIGMHCKLQSDAILHQLSRGLWIPINGKRLVPGLTGPYTDKVFGSWFRAWGFGTNKISRVLSRNRMGLRAKVRDEHLSLFSGGLRDHIVHALSTEHSVSLDLFGHSGVTQLLRARSIKVVVALLVLEQWRTLGSGIEHTARSEGD